MGNLSTPAGKSHSCDRPTRFSPKPSAATISVALGSNEMMRDEFVIQSIRPGEPRQFPDPALAERGGQLIQNNHSKKRGRVDPGQLDNDRSPERFQTPEENSS